MKFTQKISSFIALLLLATTFSSHKTHAMEPEQQKNIGWVALAGAAIVGGYAAYQQFLSYIHEEEQPSYIYVEQNLPIDPFSFTELPKEIQNEIAMLLYTGATATSLKEAAYAINSLAQVNKELNTLINDPKFCLTIIKTFALKFNCTDQEAAAALQTQEAKKRLEIQNEFCFECIILTGLLPRSLSAQEASDMYNNKKKHFDHFYNTHKEYIDLNFTYKKHITVDINGTLLNLATKRRSCSLIQILLNDGADINKAGPTGLTPLITATEVLNTNIMQCILNNQNVNINQQDNLGNTALIHCIITRAGQPNINRNNIVILLLDAGADPEIANNQGLTPLLAAQSRNNQEAIDLIQEAIHKKHGTSQ